MNFNEGIMKELKIESSVYLRVHVAMHMNVDIQLRVVSVVFS